MHSRPVTRLRTLSLLLVALVSTTVPTLGQLSTASGTFTGGSYSYTDWVPGGNVDQIGGDIYLSRWLLLSPSATYRMSGGSLTAQSLAGNRSSFDFELSGTGALTLNSVVLGDYGLDEFHQTGGTAVIGSLNLSYGLAGRYYLRGGTLTVGIIEKGYNNAGGIAQSLFYFDGGTLKASATNTTNFINNGNRIQVGTGGAFIDTNGHDINVPFLMHDPNLATPDGGLTKKGTGTLIIADADSTYSGGTRVEGGTLQLGDGYAYGWISGDVAISAGANLAFKRSDSLAYTDVVSGAGSVEQRGSGTLTLSADNTYTGGTTISTGTLTATHANALGVNGALTVASGATLNTSALGDFTVGSLSGSGNLVAGGGIFATTQSGDTTFAGVLSGTGRLAMNGTGNLTLTGHNTFTAATFANAGTIVFSNLNNLGQGANFQFNSGTLRWATGSSADLSVKNVILNATGGTIDTNGNNVVFANAIGGNGSGSLTKSGTGTLTLAGNNTYTGTTTVSAGTLQLGNGGTTGSVTGNIVNHAALTWNRADAATMAQVISGTGSLTKTGAGTLTLSAANTYTGGTTVSGGTLALTSLASFGVDGVGGINGPLHVASGASFDTSTISGITGNTASLYVSALSGAGSIAMGNGFLVVNQATDTTWSGVLSGPGRLRKLGTGTLTLTGTNTYAAATFFNEGTILFNQLANFGPSGLLRFQGGTLKWAPGNTTDISSRAVWIESGNSSFDTNGNDVTLANALGNSLTGSLTKTGTGTLTLAGNNTYTGTTTISAGTLQLGNGGTTGSLVGNIVNHSALAWNRSDAATLAQVISGSGSFTKAGTGTLTLTGANTYTGGTTVSAGTLTLAGSGQLGGSLSIGFPGTVRFEDATDASSVAIDNNGQLEFHHDATAGSGTITNRSRLSFFDRATAGSATINNRGDLIFTDSSSAGSATINHSQSIIWFSAQATAGSAAITLAESGALQFADQSTAGSASIITDGQLRFSSDSSAANSFITVSATGHINFIDNATGGNTTLVNHGAFDLGDLTVPTITFGSLAGSGRIQLGYAALTTGSTGASTTLSGVISDYGSGSLTKTGTGTLTLTGANTYRGGTTIDAGTLLANNLTGSATGTGTVTVNSGGTLGGAGTLGALTLNPGSTLAPGNSPGTLTVTDDVVWNGGANYVWEINDASSPATGAGTRYDLLSISGTLTLNATAANPFTLSLVSLLANHSAGDVIHFNAAQNSAYTIATTTGGILGFDASAFTINPASFSNSLAGGTWSVALANSNRDLALNFTASAAAIPEPSTYAALFGATVLALAAYRRRQLRVSARVAITTHL